MCGRFVFFTKDEYELYKDVLRQMAQELKASIAVLDEVERNAPGSEIFPGQQAMIIKSGSALPHASQFMTWGFPLGRSVSAKIINARAETLASKPMFAKRLQSMRCVIPATGFFEWEKTDQKKLKYRIRIAGRDILYMAGLYGVFSDLAGGSTERFTIITVNANQAIAKIHNRMPAILEPSQAADWLDGSEGGYAADMTDRLVPYEGAMETILESA